MAESSLEEYFYIKKEIISVKNSIFHCCLYLSRAKGISDYYEKVTLFFKYTGSYFIGVYL